VDNAEILEGSCIEPPKAPAHYVDNKKFLAALLEYKEAVDLAAAEGREQPQVTRYIGECFIKIATHLSYKSNFINYTFRDDMVSDGIENCLTAAAKFDPTKSSNPFAYYTAAITNSFTRVLNIEKRNQNIRDDILEENGLAPSFTRQNQQEYAEETARQAALYKNFKMEKSADTPEDEDEPV
jgi:DNA-directed RNA polymerase specialized sigma subunit